MIMNQGGQDPVMRVAWVAVLNLLSDCISCLNSCLNLA